MALIARLFALVLALSFAQGVAAQQFPALSGRVVDAANLLAPAQAADLTRLSEEIEQASSRQFVVATIPDLQGYDIADYGYRLGREWRIGQTGANNGILLIVAPNERRVRIEVGYGLEPVMPDALASRIVRDTITPRFRAGDMAGGIVAGAEAIGEQMRLPLEAAEARAKAETQRRGSRRQGGGVDSGTFLLIFWGMVVVFVVLAAIGGGRGGGGGGGGRRRRYRRGRAPVVIWGPGWGGGGGGSSWGGGGFSGGFGGGGFSGGGGSFGGGGASGGW